MNTASNTRRILWALAALGWEVFDIEVGGVPALDINPYKGITPIFSVPPYVSALRVKNDVVSLRVSLVTEEPSVEHIRDGFLTGSQEARELQETLCAHLKQPQPSTGAAA